MIRKQLLSALALCALSVPALAQTGWYVGLGLGESRTSNDLVTNRESTLVNATVTNTVFDKGSTSFKIFGGYRVLPWLALEANYADLGSSRLTMNIDANPGAGKAVMDRGVTGWGLDALVSAPLGPQAMIYGRVGAVRARTESETALSGAIVFTNGDPTDRRRTITTNETVPRAGVGAEWMFSPNTGIRVDYERWFEVGKPFEVGGSGNSGEADTDLYSLSVVYRF